MRVLVWYLSGLIEELTVPMRLPGTVIPLIDVASEAPREQVWANLNLEHGLQCEGHMHVRLG